VKIKLKLSAQWPTRAVKDVQHMLVVVAKGFAEADVHAHARMHNVLRRRRVKLADEPVRGEIDGRLCVWVEVDTAKSVFAQHTRIRNAMNVLLDEKPAALAIIVQAGDSVLADTLAMRAVYVAAVNSQYTLGKPVKKNSNAHAALSDIHLFGAGNERECQDALTIAQGNLLARRFTVRPANDLTPKRYRAEVGKLAKANGWYIKEYGFAALEKMGAGAFCAVAKGSTHRDAAIVHLGYRPKAQRRNKERTKSVAPIALVGKGICMDTGGYSLKSAKYMYGMHEDMAGSAVVLGILQVVTDLKLPFAIDAWLAISQNHIGPDAYHPGDVVTALNGTTIEIVNTDAEGRMVLADTLTLAARIKPHAIIDFATLTGAMIYALGTRKCGVFASDERLSSAAVSSAASTGERINLFTAEEDYDEQLESKLADVKQCLMGSEADAILATRFMSRFVQDTPWAHVDLSAYNNENGLGAVGSEVNGFGVAWGVELLRRLNGA
jgi:leucyl aminopeptidase